MILQRILTLLIVLGTAAAHILSTDIFPFSRYPMYSQLLTPSLKEYGYEIMGVSIEGKEHPLKVYQYMKPFWFYSLKEAILTDSGKINIKLKAALAFYNSRVSTSNELLKGIRLYRVKIDWPRVVEEIQRTKVFSGTLGGQREIISEAYQ